MNARKLLVSVLIFVSVLLAACAPAATQIAPTVVPPTAPAQEGTTFSSDKFKLPMNVSLGSEWKVAEDYSDVVSLVSDDYYVDLAFILVKDIKLADPKNLFAQVAFPDDFVTWIQEHGLFPVVETQSVVVAGFQGTEINAIVTSDCGVKTNWIFLSSTDWNCRTGEYYHFIYLEDVYGERLLIMNTGGSASEEDFDLGVEAAQNVLDTVVFSKPMAFSPKTFNLITSLSFGSDWHVEEDYLRDLYLDNGQTPIVFNIVTTAKLADPVDGRYIPFPDDFMSWIQSNPDFKTGEPTQVMIGGMNGVQIDATPNIKIDKKTFGLTWNILTSDGDWRFILLDNVNGERVLIFMIAPVGKTFNEVPELQQEIQQILDSVVFG